MRLEKTCRVLMAPVPAFVMYYWTRTLGEEFEAISRFLLPTDELAVSYPRFDNWCGYRVVVHDDGRIVGIDDEDYTDRVKLTKQDVVLHKFDLKRFRNEMCPAFGLKAAKEDTGRPCWSMSWGVWEPEKGATFPVTLWYARDNFKERVLERILKRNGPGEILLTATRLPWNDELEQLARQNKIMLIPLQEVVQAEDGKILPTPEWNEYMTAFGKIVGLNSGGEIRERNENEFRFHGDLWSVCFQGKKLHGQNLLGFRYLHLLFAKPGQPIFAQDLRRLAAGEDTLSREESVKAEETVDRVGLKKIEERYHQLQADLATATEENDVLVQQEIEAEIDKIVDYLRKNTSIHGTRKTNGNEQEKARISVSKAVGKAMKVFEKRMPELHDHLQRSLEIGIVCNYRPEQAVTWNL